MLGKYFRIAAGITYLLLDRFTTNQSAPLTSPRTCEPGPGTLTITDTTNSWSISGGRIVSSAVANTVRDPWLREAGGFARATGRAFLGTVNRYSTPGALGNDWIIGWLNSLTTPNVNQAYGMITSSGTPFNLLGCVVGTTPALIDTFAFDTDHTFAIVQRSSGFFAVMDGLLQWVGESGTDATLFPSILNRNVSTRNLQIDDIRVVDLTGSWATDTGIATSVTSSPSSGATATMTADAIIEFSWTPASTETLELDVRRTDANNRWIIRCDQVGATIKTIERNASVETERASSAQTWTVGTPRRIVVICIGNNIYNFVANAAKNTYTSASFNNTATGVAVAGFATGTNLITWPHSVTITPIGV